MAQGWLLATIADLLSADLKWSLLTTGAAFQEQWHHADSMGRCNLVGATTQIA